MKKKWSQGGVSEVIGTILILAMTVVLFATIIIWVSTIPTPQASIRLDMNGDLAPIYDTSGAFDGVNVTILHRGGESLFSFRTAVVFSVTRSGLVTNERLSTKGILGGVPYGIDGSDADWDTGERWRYSNYSIFPTDRITMTVIDTMRSLILWQETLAGLEGTRPPLFLEKWADRFPQTATIDVPVTNREFTIFARVTDPDGDLRKNSVYVYLAFLYGTPLHRSPQRMYDDGTNGDLVANDGVFTSSASFYKPPALNWDGGVVLFNATDQKSHAATSRMTLEVQEGPPATKPPPRGFESGRPPNLNYNGLQGFNIFNATEWDEQGFNATDTRTFREGEEVVVVVGSAILTDTFGRNLFMMYDPFSNLPLDPVVYGANKQVNSNSQPSSTEAFDFFVFQNGYNLFILRFELNNASSVGINFVKCPTPPAPFPQYCFASYPIEFDIIDFLGNRFYTSDSIHIMANDGTIANYPKLETFSDPGFTTSATEYSSTDVVYVRIRMRTLDPTITTVIMGNVVIQDFFGGTQLFRAPKSGHDANPPICPVTGACTGVAIERHPATTTYRFSINLTLADQDPWVPGAQHYSLRILSMVDTDESYSLVLSAQLLITAPLYLMDIVAGTDDTQNNAWGSHDVSYYWLNLNGIDRWRQERLHQGADKTVDYTKSVAYFDFDLDNDLDVVASLVGGNPVVYELYFYRQDQDQDGNIVWTRTLIETTTAIVNDIRTGDLNGDTAPEIVVGGDNGHLWYYQNDGSWTKVVLDTTAVRINAVDVFDFDGDNRKDIVVARDARTVTYYKNPAFARNDLTLTGEGSGVATIAIDAGDYNENGKDDVFVATSSGKVFRFVGDTGGLVLVPNGPLITGLTAIGGLKLGNVTLAQPGLELAVAVNLGGATYGARVYNVQTNSPSLLSTTPVVGNGQAITSLVMGDVDGDGDDDLVVSTTGTNAVAANIVYFRNRPDGWFRIQLNPKNPGSEIFAKIWDLDLGDMDKAQFVGR